MVDLVVSNKKIKSTNSQNPLIMMSYKLIQPAMNICIGIGTADLIANIIVYLQYRQIVE